MGAAVDTPSVALAIEAREAVTETVEVVTAAPSRVQVGTPTPTLPPAIAGLRLGPTNDEEATDLSEGRTTVGISAGPPTLQDVVPVPLMVGDRLA